VIISNKWRTLDNETKKEYVEQGRQSLRQKNERWAALTALNNSGVRSTRYFSYLDSFLYMVFKAPSTIIIYVLYTNAAHTNSILYLQKGWIMTMPITACTCVNSSFRIILH
jgi:hypothetical protein